MKNFITYGRQFIDKKDLLAVQQSLKNEKITTGALVEKFEKKINQFLKCKYSVSCNSGTSALFLAFKAIDLKKNDKVIMPSINFVSSYNIAKLFDAQIFLADVDKSSGQMTPNDVEDCCKKFKLKNVKALVVMYNGGYPQNADKFYKLKKKYGFKIIEDASHAVGGTYNGSPVGSCLYSDITVLSFHPVKIITSGEGGMALTNSASLSAAMERLRSHGITRDKNLFQHASDGPWYYEQIDLGLNYRLTDIAAALGLSQFQRLDSFVARRNEIAHDYDSLFLGSIFTTPTIHNDVISAFHLYVIRMAFTGDQKQRFFELAHKNGVGLNVHYIPIYHQPYYSQMGFDSADFPVAEKYYSEAVSIPMYADLTFEQQQHVASVLISTAATVSH